MPTILDFAKCDIAPKLPLDGVSQFSQLWLRNFTSPRIEILHGLDPYKTVRKTLIDPRPFPILAGRSFSTRMNAALRYNKWKLITGPLAAKHHIGTVSPFQAVKSKCDTYEKYNLIILIQTYRFGITNGSTYRQQTLLSLLYCMTLNRTQAKLQTYPRTMKILLT